MDGLQVPWLVKEVQDASACLCKREGQMDLIFDSYWHIATTIVTQDVIPHILLEQ